MERRKYQDKQEKIIGGMNDCIMNDAIVIQNKVIEELTKEYAEYLEKEKEQIMNAHTNAYLIGEDDISVEDANKASEQYYNQTYNQNK
jgi:ATP-dependent protease Clp ATPase subunit